MNHRFGRRLVVDDRRASSLLLVAPDLLRPLVLVPGPVLDIVETMLFPDTHRLRVEHSVHRLEQDLQKQILRS